MGKDVWRVVVLAVVAIAMIVVGAVVVDWFQMKSHGTGGGSEVFALNLQSLKLCEPSAVCRTLPVSATGTFGTFATPTFWVAIGFCIALAFVTFLCARGSDVPPFAIRIASLLGILGLLLAVCTGYVFGPNLGTGTLIQAPQITVTIDRGLAPLLLILGCLVGLVALVCASSFELVARPQAVTVIPPAYIPLSERTKRPSELMPMAPRGNSPTTPLGERVKSATVAPPDHLKGRIQYLAVIAEVTRAGIDARREDGTSLLVMWGDVVGAVARRLPEALGGATFIDIVSTAGSTLRVLPWTRLTGDEVLGDGDGRARSLLELVIARARDAKLDATTRAFVSAQGSAHQVPDLETLALHDQRLA